MTETRALWGLPDPYSQSEFYADVPVKRFIAWIVDTILILMIVVLAIVLTVGLGLFFAGFLYLVIGFIYRVVSLANRSATPGMRMAAIEFRRHDGTPLDLGYAALHTLGYSVSMAMVFPQVISVILMLTGARKQGLTDLVLGTAAVNRNAAS